MDHGPHRPESTTATSKPEERKKNWPQSISYAAVSSSHGRRPRDFRGIYCHRLAEWRGDFVAPWPHFAAGASIGKLTALLVSRRIRGSA